MHAHRTNTDDACPGSWKYTDRITTELNRYWMYQRRLHSIATEP
jgi:hypothetical protein